MGDEKKLRTLYDRRLAAEVDGADLGDEFKGYVFKILGGQDKQGFPMKQGVLTADRVRLMMSKAPKIQRLVTPIALQRKRHRLAVKKARQTKAKTEAAEYQKLLALRQKESREKRAEKISQRRSQRSSRAED